MPSADFRGIVLSGGGAKGAYSAGLLAALNAADQYSDAPPSRFYSGSSVGALNAVMAAQGDVDELLRMYRTLGSRDIIGYDTSWIRVRWIAKAVISGVTGQNFHTYDNDFFKRFIREKVEFDKLKENDSHITISATDYITGNRDTFYISRLFDEFVKYEEDEDPNSRRLKNYYKIDSEELLIDVLLASSAFPTIFPPVRIEDKLYVDGGVGNNTPTPQAAYFGRFLNELKDMYLGRVYCNVLTPERFTEEPDNRSPLSLTMRIFQLFQNKIRKDALISWSQINRNQRKLRRQKERIIEVLEEAEMNEDDKERVKREVESIDPSTSSTERIEMDLRKVRPAIGFSLDTIFDFDSESIDELIDDGYTDCIRSLEEDGLLKQAQAEALRSDPNYGIL